MYRGTRFICLFYVHVSVKMKRALLYKQSSPEKDQRRAAPPLI